MEDDSDKVAAIKCLLGTTQTYQPKRYKGRLTKKNNLRNNKTRVSSSHVSLATVKCFRYRLETMLGNAPQPIPLKTENLLMNNLFKMLRILISRIQMQMLQILIHTLLILIRIIIKLRV